MKHIYNTPLIEHADEWGNPKTMQARLLDSFIVASITFFSTLAVLGYPPSPKSFWAAGLAWCFVFFSQWGYERNIKRFSSSNKPDSAQDDGK